MSHDEHGSSPLESASDAGGQPEPYQTPNVVSDQPVARSALASPAVWAITASVIVGAAIVAIAWSRNESSSVQYIEEFGDYRRGPVPDYEGPDPPPADEIPPASQDALPLP